MTYVNKRSVTAVGILFPVLTVAALATRTYGWRRHSRNLDIDDILIVPASVLVIAAGVAMAIGAQMDIVGGHSLPQITPTMQQKLGKFEYSFWIGHILAIGFIKLAILFLFRRIFQGRSYRTAFDYANWVLITLVILWTTVFFFFEVFACGTTPAASWTSLYSLRHACIDTFSMQTACAVFNWIMDLAILIEPLLMIGTLNMSTRRKLQTSIVFLFSTFAVIAGLLRMIIWIQMKVQDVTHETSKVLNTALPTADQLGLVSIVLFWTYIEIGVGFLVACLPPCAWLFDKIPLGPIWTKLRSLPSMISIPKGDSRSRPGEDTDMDESLRPWTTLPNKVSSSRGDDELELVTRTERV